MFVKEISFKGWIKGEIRVGQKGRFIKDGPRGRQGVSPAALLFNAIGFMIKAVGPANPFFR
jgi:hypothetical protein